MTREQKNASCLVLVIVLVCLLGLALLSRREPTYQGKPLSEWAQQYGSNHWGGANRAVAQEAELAIRQIGTNGIPFLLDLIRTRDPVLKKKLRTVVPQRWHDKLRLRDNSGTIRR